MWTDNIMTNTVTMPYYHAVTMLIICGANALVILIMLVCKIIKCLLAPGRKRELIHNDVKETYNLLCDISDKLDVDIEGEDNG